MKVKAALAALILTTLTIALYAESAITPPDAVKMLKAGAVLVDVRTAKEFAAKHLPGATNIPLATIKVAITNVAPSKSTPVLLHCQSGGRSAAAEKELRALGYTNCFNLGSYAKAEEAVKARNK